MNIKHAFSIDLEDWYHGIELPQSDWKGKEYRLEKGLDVILEILEETNSKITFFCLGWIGDEYGHIVKKISDLGHEIGSHCYSHEKIYHLSPTEFEEELRKTKHVLEDLTGQKVIGNRSPYFSITKKSLWGLELLHRLGFKYDCSISPIETWRYGIKGSPQEVYRFEEFDLIEFPTSTTKFFGKEIVIGGAYFRIFPYYFFRKAFKQAKSPLMFYSHPWEYDPYHPSEKMEWKAKLTHYFNLKGMAPRTKKLLKEFPFQTVNQTIVDIGKTSKIKTISLKDLNQSQIPYAS